MIRISGNKISCNLENISSEIRSLEAMWMQWSFYLEIYHDFMVINHNLLFLPIPSY